MLTQVPLCSCFLEFHVDLKCPAERAVNAEYAFLKVAVCECGVYLLRGEVVEGPRVVKHKHLEVGRDPTCKEMKSISQ